MERLRALIFPPPPLRATRVDVGLFLLRVFAGLGLAFAHGLRKLPPPAGFVDGVAGMGFPAPLVFAWLAGLSEFAGGLLLALGLLTRPSAFLALCTLFTAAFISNAGAPFGERELALLYGAVMLLYLIVGSGRWGIDTLLAGPPRRSRW